MNRFKLSSGDIVTTKLSAGEYMKRLRRLDTLRVMTEQHECEEGQSICKKAFRAYNKLDHFTGIIRLTPNEKDWLGYKLESDFIDEEDIECIRFYCGIND